MEELLAAMDKFAQEVAVEGKRMVTQGSMELASALFNGHAFVPYGPGQYTPQPDRSAGIDGQTQEQSREFEGLGR